MYNWFIINTIGFLTGVLSAIIINLICKIFNPVIYESYYGLYIMIQIIFGAFMGYSVCEWYSEKRERYYRLRYAMNTDVLRYYYYNYNSLDQRDRSNCIKKINEMNMD